MTIHAFKDGDDFMNYFMNLEKESIKALEASEIKPEQLTHGVCFVRVENVPGIGDVPIFAETLVPFRDFYGDEEEFLEDQHSDNDSRRKGYIFGKHYSEICPEGELGSCHVNSIAMIISKDDFEAARKSGWTRSINPRLAM